MSTIEEFETRIEELEADLRSRDDKIKQLRQELRQAVELVDEMREHVEDSNAVIESWIESFNMEKNEDGLWTFEPWLADLSNEHGELLDRHQKLVADWNKMVARWNKTVGPQPIGRPLAASEAQARDVFRRRKAGDALRKIVAETGLTMRTVRTILDKDQGTDRTAQRRNLLRKREFDRQRAADYRARKRTRDGLPKRITETRNRGDELIKAAKGLADV